MSNRTCPCLSHTLNTDIVHVFHNLSPIPVHISQAQKLECPHLYALPAIQLRPNIQIEIQRLPLLSLILARVEVNDILDPRPAPIHDPIMPIERGGVPHPGIQPRARRHGARQAGEALQPRPVALCGREVGLLPLLDLLPGALVDGVVDGHDGLHVLCGGVEGLAAHGFEEHAFGGVDPVSGGGVGGGVAFGVCGAGGGSAGCARGEGARDGGDFAGGVEGAEGAG